MTKLEEQINKINTEYAEWFQDEYKRRCKYKLDMGKSCVRFKRMDDIPYDLVGELISKISVQDWIELYETQVKSARTRKN